MSATNERQVGIGIIGLGRHGERYANHTLAGDAPNARLVAVQRRDAEQGQAFADERGVRFHATPEALLADPEVDAVVITTPTKQHLPMAELAVGAGKHILCEKPMARSVEECRLMRDAADAAGLKVAIGQTMRFGPILDVLREKMPEVGELYALHACMRQERSPTAWHLDADLAGGGVVVEVGVHLFDALRYLSGRDITRVAGEMRDTYDAGVETYATGIAWLEGGATSSFEIAKTVDGRLTRFEAVGSEGALIANLTTNTLERVHGREITEIDVPDNVPTIPILVQGFCEAILDGSEPPVTADDGLHTLAVCEAFYASVESGVAVDVRI
jgi:predicted dehydrogenase